MTFVQVKEIIYSTHLILIAYGGKYCEDDFDGCTEVSCFGGGRCTDVPAPGTGATCPPCPSGYTGDGIVCNGKNISTCTHCFDW